MQKYYEKARAQYWHHIPKNTAHFPQKQSPKPHKTQKVSIHEAKKKISVQEVTS